MPRIRAIDRSSTQPPPLQPAAEAVWDQKYRLKRSADEPVDLTPADTLARVARALAEVEAPEDREHWFARFRWALDNGALPAGRIIANAGAGALVHGTSTINCTVSGVIEDTMESILERLYEAGMTLKRGSGIGYEFSTLRPRGAFVAGPNAHTSGPLSFMDVYDSMCRTISSAGGRRGAQMATFDVGHPDVFDFIDAKRQDGRLRQFNLSLLITGAFLDAVKGDSDWPLAFPLSESEIERDAVDVDDAAQVLWRPWPTTTGYRVNARGEVACRIYRSVRARTLWDAIMAATYDYAEPGFILIDRVNEMNNNWFCETIRATNPCGEQPLPPYGACLLGSIDLTRLVLEPFTERAHFDWPRYREVVRVFTRMLDNVVALHGLSLAPQAAEIERKRRHGMGFLGLGSALAMLGMRYGETASLEFTERVSRELALEGWREGLALAKEKGPAPIMEEPFPITEKMLALRPELAADGFKAGDVVPGRVLLARYSRYMQQLAGVDAELVAAIALHGARFTHHSSIAPTGTISLALANNASNGIEPSFAHKYSRNIIAPGRKAKERVAVYSCEALAYRAFAGENAPLPAWFVTADDVTPRQHVDMQAAAQRWIDSSISKTANVPTDFPFEDFKDIYRYACDQGLKGCTTFRFNPERFQGVLVRDADLRETRYRFTLEDGSVVEARGDEEIEYEGELHTAANLFDALKEGYYGRL